jgi:hypothetical protein
MKEILMAFVGVDYWNRPVFKDITKEEYYGSTDMLFSECAGEWEVINTVEVEDLVYFGNSFACEPMGIPCPADEEWVIQVKENKPLWEEK